MDKADPNIIVYVVIVLRVCNGMRKQVPGTVIGLLWFNISHGSRML